MSRPTRQTAAGRAYLDLQNRARREQRTTQELLTLYVLERWLARDLANDQAKIAGRVRDVAQVRLADDGVNYLVETITVQTIRDDADYAGVRITMDCQVSTAMLKLDINIGDPVTPEPMIIQLPSQRPGTPVVRVLGYPIETVLAEKTSTAIALGEANTRVRDYADLHVLTGKHTVPFTTMRAALQATTRHRGVTIQPLSEVVGEVVPLRRAAYDAFRRRLGPDGQHLPIRFADVVADVVRFVDPLANAEGPMTWNPALREWRRFDL